MGKRFMSIWFRHLMTDWMTLRHPELKDVPFVLAMPDHGRLVITASNTHAQAQGIYPGMLAADAKAVTPDLQVKDDLPDLPVKLLGRIGEWCIRYTPVIATDLPDGLILDISGCAHLWGDERKYLREIVRRLQEKGYDVRAAIADTIGAAYAVARFGKISPIIRPGEHITALLALPAVSLRIEQAVLERLQKLGLHTIQLFVSMPRSALRRRFGTAFLQRLDQALGNEEEHILPIIPVAPYQERLPCLEPIRNAAGIEIALRRLLEMLCERLKKEGKGIRKALFKGYRIDGKTVQIEIGTNRASHHISHLFKLFELKISSIEPALGIELFVLEVNRVEDIAPEQETLWIDESSNLDCQNIAELLDRLAGKVGANAIHRYLPEEHYWPERSIKLATAINEKPAAKWRTDKMRPVQLLPKPQPIEVTAPIPDYPPMLFRYNGQVHTIKKADGPERIEREWWIDAGEHRDYYQVEDEEGKRYWLFRSGHYSAEESQWFIHGFFA
jgi:protein ImuB